MAATTKLQRARNRAEGVPVDQAIVYGPCWGWTRGFVMDYLLCIAVGPIGSLASAIFGFGTALLVLAVGPHILPVKETMALATVLFTEGEPTGSRRWARSLDDPRRKISKR